MIQSITFSFFFRFSSLEKIGIERIESLRYIFDVALDECWSEVLEVKKKRLWIWIWIAIIFYLIALDSKFCTFSRRKIGDLDLFVYKRKFVDTIFNDIRILW